MAFKLNILFLFIKLLYIFHHTDGKELHQIIFNDTSEAIKSEENGVIAKSTRKNLSDKFGLQTQESASDYQSLQSDFFLPNYKHDGIQFNDKNEKLEGKYNLNYGERDPNYLNYVGRDMYRSNFPRRVRSLHKISEPRKYPMIIKIKPKTTTPRSSSNDSEYTTTSTTTIAPQMTIPQSSGDKPDACNTSFDAVATIRDEVFFFKGKYVWRLGNAGLHHGYPIKINFLWRDLPQNLTHIDAVYERPDKKIIFFIGRQYYLFNSIYLEKGYPKILETLGLPDSLDHIDGALVRGYDDKTYFFSGTEYWRYNEDTKQVELQHYPQPMRHWKGVGFNIDAVFQWKDGNTYFFKGNGFWKFNDLRMQVYNKEQILSGPFWFRCSKV